MPNTTYSHLRVLDLSTNIAGPLAAMIFGDHGADVIKVERAPLGDDTRQLSPKWEGQSTVFLAVNRNKRSILIDYKSESDLRNLRTLIASADIVIESFPPGFADRLQLTFDDIRKIQPRVIVCSVSAFGDGPTGSNMPGYDALVQSVSGLMSFTGHSGDEPVRIAPSVLDITTGMWGAMGIMAALQRQSLKSEPEHIRVALIDSAFTLMCHQVQGFMATGSNPEKLGSGAPSAAPYRVYQANDGYFMLATASNPQFQRLCAILDLVTLAQDVRFATMDARIDNRSALDGVLSQKFAQESTAHWLDLLSQNGLSVGNVNDLSTAMDLDITRERQLFFTNQLTGCSKEAPMLRLPIDVAGEGYYRPAPALGEHTREILGEAGLPAGQ